jgi:hypothetical protein
MVDFSSYSFNAYNLMIKGWPGIGGMALNSIVNPEKTVLIGEAPAWQPYSWHEPKYPLPTGHELSEFNNAKNEIGFVDGHVDYIKIYWSTNIFAHGTVLTCSQNPPAGYDYKWSGD